MKDLISGLFASLLIEVLVVAVALIVKDDKRKTLAVLVIGTVIAGLVWARGEWSPSPETILTPVTSETAMPLRADYQTLSLQAYSKRGELETTSTLLGLKPGTTTNLSDQDIPFQLGWTASTNCSVLPQDPESFQVAVELHNPTHIYVLIQAGNAAKSYNGKEVGKIRAVFSDGSEAVTTLILGQNIRDWSRTNPTVVSTLGGDDIQSVWEGQTSQGAAGGIDMLTIKIPDSHQSSVLVGIKIEDTSTATIGTSDPCIHIPGITVRYLK